MLLARNEFNATNMRNVRYGLQRVFLNFLEAADVREERVPNNRGRSRSTTWASSRKSLPTLRAYNYEVKERRTPERSHGHAPADQQLVSVPVDNGARL